MPRSDNEDPSVPLPSSLLPLGQALGATAAALLLLVPLGTILTLVVRHAPVQVWPDMLHTHSGGDIGSVPEASCSAWGTIPFSLIQAL